MNIREFTNCYPVSKTLRFRLIPIGRTEENININRVLEKDEKRAEEYKHIKEIIDRYHVKFIENTLRNVEFKEVEEYIDLCQKKERTNADIQSLKKVEEELRKKISKLFSSQPMFKTLFSKELITNILPEFVDNDTDLEIVKNFSKFTTAFVGFNNNRKNIYTSEPIPTAIAFRCINDNLPKFISNIGNYEKIKGILGTQIDFLTNEIEKLGYSLSVDMCFSKETYGLFISQSGIDVYNAVIGGWVTDEGVKVQGLNEYINLYNQQLDKNQKSMRLPKFQILYKQILSETESVSFYREGLKNDEEFLDVFKSLFDKESVFDACIKCSKLISEIENYDSNGIFISNGLPLTAVSKGAYGSWNAFGESWAQEYRTKNPIGRTNPENYEKKLADTYKKIPSFSVQEINDLIRLNNPDTTNSVELFFKESVRNGIEAITSLYERMKPLLNTETEGYTKTEEDVAEIKCILDAIKNYEKLLGYVKGTGLENGRDEIFYGEFLHLFDKIRLLDVTYDTIRNYVTQKAFSENKFKLYFDQGDFLSGWDAGGNGGKRCAFLLKDGNYYLMISASKTLPNIEGCSNSDKCCYEKIDYRLLTGANKMLPKVFFPKTDIEKFNPGGEILRIKNAETFKKGPAFNANDCHKLIGFYQDCISKYEWGEKFDFKFKKPSEYEDISKFYRDIELQGYKLIRQQVSAEEIDSLVEDGKIYLFQIYNKDFSKYSHGKPNLHTMYFKSLFDEENQLFVKLNGGAEMFMRRASIRKENRVIHPAGIPISSKNYDNSKKSSTFGYDLIKDKRYTVDQFEFHVPIQLNWSAYGNIRINDCVRKALKADTAPFVIGIDRGERNLLYVCVIDSNGNIVEQYSLNSIINEYNGVSHKTDYHRLLDQKEAERKTARQNWTTIENIKELKAGYLSQVVHKICQLVIKYNAVIALEDLNMGFKRGRTKVEKQVYQNFEKALIDKLNYMADKDIAFSEKGSIVQGFQLTEKFDSFSRMKTQNGILFYIPAWLTSKIDPVTGFADLIKPKYENRDSCRAFIMSFDKINYSMSEDMFAFELDYTKFSHTEADFIKHWVLYTNGERIRTYRNPQKNNEWDYEEIHLTTMTKEFLDKYRIEYADGEDLREKLVKESSKEFYCEFIDIIKLMLQMRNSISGEVDIDYLISPVKNAEGKFYDSRVSTCHLPQNADANGAYNIARKVLWAIEQFKMSEMDNVANVKIAISNKEWLKYAQTRNINE